MFPAPLYVLILPLLFIPDLGLSTKTSFGVIDPSDWVLILLYPALLFGARNGPRPPLRVSVYFVDFLVVALVSTLLIPDSYAYSLDEGNRHLLFGLVKLAKFTAYALLGYLLASRLARDEHSEQALAYLMAGALLLSGVIILTFIYEAGSARGSIKSIYPYEASNGASVMLAAMGVYLAALPRSRVFGIPRAVVLVVIALAMLMTTGRGGWLGAGAGLAYISWRGRYGSRRATGAVIFAAVALAAVAWFAPVRQGAEKLLVETQPGTYAINDAGRFSHWTHQGSRIADTPILGRGFYHRTARSGLWASGAHNMFIQMALETGLVGLAFFLLVLRGMWRSVPLDANAKEETPHADHGMAFRGAMVAVCMASMTETYLYGGMVLGALSLLYGTTLGFGSSGAGRREVPAYE